MRIEGLGDRVKETLIILSLLPLPDPGEKSLMVPQYSFTGAFAEALRMLRQPFFPSLSFAEAFSLKDEILPKHLQFEIFPPSFP